MCKLKKCHDYLSFSSSSLYYFSIKNFADIGQQIFYYLLLMKIYSHQKDTTINLVTILNEFLLDESQY